MYEWPSDTLISEWATWSVEEEYEKLRKFIDDMTPMINLTNSWGEYAKEIEFLSQLRLELVHRNSSSKEDCPHGTL